MGTIQDWFARRTYASSDFDVTELSARRAELGQTVSVVLPARNEQPTIGGVVEAAAALVPALVDEIVVLDGGSGDDTVALARAAGAVVYDDSSVLPEHGRCLGKGDALWRSLSVTSGDLVVFVDTDIRNPDPRFVYGLLGPLLADPEVAFVKAFYERPMQVSDVLHPTGGGRVTELCARPLLNTFWPELAGLVQPLSGEYAGRRDLLEQLPFFSGYGVEIGLLIDTLARSGADAIAQVDLFERVHRNQPLESLSRMSFAILQVALQRLDAAGQLDTAAYLGRDYVQFERVEAAVQPRPVRVGDVERPPLRSLGEHSHSA